MKIHILWVGRPLDNLNHYEDFSTQNHWEKFNPAQNATTLFTKMRTYFSELLTRDVAGFFSFLDAVIKARNNSIELYFHCFEAYVSIYKTILENFCNKINQKYYKSGSEFVPNLHVVSFEASVKLFTAEQEKTGCLIQAYLNFVQDPRVKNLRHLNFCKEIFAFCILYLYGGYTFDGNVFVLSTDFQRAFHPSNTGLESFTTIPLINSLEQSFIFDSQNLQHRELKFILKLNESSYCAMQKSPTGLYLPRNATNVFWTNLISSDFAQRSLHKIPALLLIINFMVQEVIGLIRKCYEKHTSISEQKASFNVNQYFFMSGGITGAAPLIPKMIHFSDPSYPQPPNDPTALKIYLKEKTKFLLEDNKIFLSLIPQERVENRMDLFATLKYIPCETYLFLNFPLIKFSYKSYNVKAEYFEKKTYSEECAAAAEWL